jgi:hypothetical protein
MIVTLTMPQAFGHSDEATLELLLKSASDAEIAAGSVQDPQSAREAREQVRAVVLKLMAHPQADTDLVGAVRSGLEATMARLEALEKNYDVSAASVHRKRSHQAGYNLAEPSRAYSSIVEDQSMAYALREAAQSMPAPAMAMAEDDAFGLLPAEKWLSFPALPVGMAGEAVRVVLANPRDGFLVAEIEKATGRRVLPERNGMAEEEIRRALQAH